ncbi:30S ribosome-binding factor RbfA, partial [Candidatus Saccharibacteria bacterium]|nr:30S ribosome-binding factor RbfA [Candidatus Saccharibacteria bacterium]NIW80860.1 30S ribosome-binding factor RbfA [Calditrichia bacterium]
METIRQKKLADQIKKVISQVVDKKLKDPRKGFITITHVKLSGDLRIASIYFTVLGDKEEVNKSIDVLNRANHFIRGELASHINTRYVPELRFFVDDT